MSEPARAAAPAPPADHPEHVPDPRAPGWADVRCIIAADSHLVALAAEQVAVRPGDSKALVMLDLARQVMESAIQIGRRWVLDEKTLDAEREAAYEQGVADCKAVRCRLRSVPGPR